MMAKVPQCWRECKTTGYREEIDRERKSLFEKMEQGIENLQKIRQLIYSGDIEEVYAHFADCQNILGTCLGEFQSILSIRCTDCKHRNFDIGKLKPESSQN